MQILTALLTMAVIIGFAPRIGMPVYAESNGLSMTMGAGVLGQNVNTPDAQTVWYADKTWRVIGYDSKDTWASEEDVATLLSAVNLEQTPFNENNTSNVYSTSLLKEKVDQITEDLTPGEKKAIRTRTLESGPYEGQFTNCIAGPEVPDTWMWPLSSREANDVNRELRKPDPEHPYWESSYWWLRSPGSMKSAFSQVAENGLLYSNIMPLPGSACGVRPAFYLNLESVLFTSAAENGKVTGEAGADALTEVTNAAGSEWKVTVLDPERNFKITQLNQAGNVFTVNYSGAKIGANEYISAVIQNSNGDVTYYGRLKNVTSDADASGEISINTEGKFNAGDTIYVFNEQCNGDKKTDYASKLQGIYTVTFLNGYEEEPIKSEIVLEGKNATAPENPTRKGYSFKGWDKDFSNVTSNLNVTAEWELVTYTVTFVDDLENVFDTQTVVSGNAATAPEVPVRYGYTFKGWDKDFSNVTGDLTVTAIYEPIKVTSLRFRKVPSEIDEGKEADITVSIEPVKALDKSLEWSSSDTDVLTVDENGHIEGLKAGKATVTVRTKDGSDLSRSRIIKVNCAHDWGGWSPTKPATAEEAGEETRECSKCGEKETRVIPIDHDHDLILEETEATCTSSGMMAHYKCSKCEALFKDAAGTEVTSAGELRIPPTGHIGGDPVKEGDETAATCSLPGGYNLYTRCENCNAVLTVERFEIPIDPDAHVWGEWKVITPATTSAEGVETRTCSLCDEQETRAIPKIKPEPTPAPGSDPNQKGADGTAVGPGASAACADKAITSMKSDNDPAGSKFAPLKLKSTKQGKNSVKLACTKAKGATSYVIYGNACGTKNKMKKLTTVKTNSYNVKKISKKLKKGTYHKFIVVALDKNNNVVSTSKLIHVATTGGKVGNNKSVTVTKKVVNKAKKLKKGKTLKLKAKAIAKSKKLKVKKHKAVRYESTNTKIATVSNAGVVKAKKKGTCYIYAYAQNGVSKKIKVTVK